MIGELGPIVKMAAKMDGPGDEDFEVRSFFKPLSFMYMKQVVCCSFEQHSSHPCLYFQVSFKGNQSTDVQSELETTFNGKEK